MSMVFGLLISYETKIYDTFAKIFEGLPLTFLRSSRTNFTKLLATAFLMNTNAFA